MKTLSKFILSATIFLGASATLYAQAPVDEVESSNIEEVSTSATTQNYDEKFRETTVLVIGDPQNNSVKVQALEYFYKTVRQTPQQVGMPRFMITDKKSRAVFAIGGFVNFRTAYDFNAEIQNIDFQTYDIPMTSTPYNRQRFLMDASTSRLYFKTVINTKRVGPIEAYIETDFRGESGNILRLREAYVSFAGFLAGQTVTTFCDLEASPNTIDFEGPNAYTYGRNMMLRYSHRFNKNWKLAVAAEYPTLSATVGSFAAAIPQRVPDIPAYVQYSWNNEQSHVRLSGIVRNLSYLNKVTDKTTSSVGYGVQLSSFVKFCKFASMTGQVLYGQGISPYIQDLAGEGLDLIPDPQRDGKLVTPPVMSWMISTQMNITKKLAFTLGYSQVSVWNKDGYFNHNEYRLSQYIVSNLIYNFTPAIQAGIEYLYGTRINQDSAFAKAHRIQAMVQVSF